MRTALHFGGDYNPEQWDETVWREDIALMRDANVTTVTLGVFSWAFIEVDDDVWDWGWFDRIIGMLSDAGIGIDLATPTAAPPRWLHEAHPDILPVDRRGIPFSPGGRLGWCPDNPTWQRYSTRVARRLGERYGSHPAVTLWHVSNELGGGNRHCYCMHSSAAFRRWAQARYGDIEALNTAWGTAFWGLRYRRFDDVTAPLASEAAQNPSLLLAFDRFSSDALAGQYRRERDALRAAGATAPITTNLMLTTGGSVADYTEWMPDLDVVAIDHYTQAADPRRERDLAFVASRARGMDRASPWLLMEHAAGAVNWQPRNRPKAPGEMIRHSLQHVAHGSDGALFFQWRASAAGAEQFHSAMLPHAGAETRQWREVCELGGMLARIGEVAGSVVEPTDTAILVDIPANWAWEDGQKPIRDYPIERAGRRWFEALVERGLVPDVVSPRAALDGYRLIVVPGLYAVHDELADVLTRAAAAGATVVIGHLSGIVDAENRVRLGGYPGAFRGLLGVVAEEFHPLLEHERVRLSSGSVATDWVERVRLTDAAAIDTYADAPLAGAPAITRRAIGGGSAWYVSADVAEGLGRTVDAVVADAAIAPHVPVVGGVEAVRRVRGDAAWLFLVNHGGDPAVVSAAGLDLVSGAVADETVIVAAGGVAVIRERPST